MDEDAEELEESLDGSPEEEASQAALEDSPEALEEAEETLAGALLELDDAEPDGPEGTEPRTVPDGGELADNLRRSHRLGAGRG